MSDAGDGRRFAPAAARNRDPILSVLARILPEGALVLEVASGTGEHAIHFGSRLPGITWQPTDPDEQARRSIDAWRADAGLDAILPAKVLDVRAPEWPVTRADAVVAINLVHISPWSAFQGLLMGAARVLPAGGLLFLYGPYRRGGSHTAPSNEAFDQSLRQRDPAWGVRDLEHVVETASSQGLRLIEVVEMPANNLSVVFANEGATG